MVSTKSKPKLANDLLTLLAMNTLEDRLRFALKEAREKNTNPSEKINQAWLSRQVGISTAGITKWFNGGTQSLEGENLIKAAKALGVSAAWLATGQGSIYPDQREAASAPVFPRAASEDDYALIPQYSTKGSCGGGELNDHVELLGGLAFKRDWLKRFGLKDTCACVIYACGSSMAPTLDDGDVVLLDCSSKELRNGKIYALCIDGEVRIKRVHINFGKITLVSDNPDKLRYPDQEVPADVELDVIGRGVWQGGGL